MKNKYYKLLVGFFLVFMSCSKQEELIILSPNQIAFVHANGTPIIVNECINPKIRYAIAITTKKEGSGTFVPIIVAYSINGKPYSMSFSSDGTKLENITLVDGINKAEISSSSLNASLYFNAQSEFEVVN